MEIDEAVELPSVGQQLHGAATWDVVGEVGGEGVTDVEVAIAVFALEAVTILRIGEVDFAGFVEGVSPGVGSLGGEVVPAGEAEQGLEGVVIGSCFGLNLVDDTVIRTRIRREVCKLGRR